MDELKKLKKDVESLKKKSFKLESELNNFKKEFNNKLVKFEKESEEMSDPVSEDVSQEIQSNILDEESNQKIRSDNAMANGIALLVLGAFLFLLPGFLRLIGFVVFIVGLVKVISESSKKRSKSEGVTKRKKSKNRTSIEESIGIKWFSIAGIIALVLGVGFFVKYAIDMNWIGHFARIASGVILGIVLVVFGEMISKKEKYKYWGKTLSGGGFAITYFVLFAAYYFIEYREILGITQPLAFSMLGAVIFIMVMFSLKDKSQIIAGGAFLLGFLTTVLASDLNMLLVSYLCLLILGLVIVSSYMKWAHLGLLGVVGAYAALLYAVIISNTFFEASFLLISAFIFFSAQELILLKKQEVSNENMFASILNALSFFSIHFFLILNFYPDFVITLTLSLAFVYFIKYYLLLGSRKVLEKFAKLYFFLCLFFAGITIPLEFNLVWTTIIWVFMSLFLVFLSTQLKMSYLRISGYFLSIAASIKLLLFDWFIKDSLMWFPQINSSRLITYAIAIICFYVIGALLKRISTEKNIFSVLYNVLATTLLVGIIIVEFVVPYTLLSTFLLGLTSIILFGCVKKNAEEFYILSIIVLGILLLKTLIYTTFFSEFQQASIILNLRYLSYILAISTFFLFSRLAKQKEKEYHNLRLFSIPYYVFSYPGSLLAAIIISLEFTSFYISIWWGLLALVLIINGFSLNERHLRIQGIMLFAITIFKVFIIDTSHLEPIYRTVSYIILGGLLLTVSFTYSTFKKNIKKIF